jgi:hypothetical protein
MSQVLERSWLALEAGIRTLPGGIGRAVCCGGASHSNPRCAGGARLELKGEIGGSIHE